MSIAIAKEFTNTYHPIFIKIQGTWGRYNAPVMTRPDFARPNFHIPRILMERANVVIDATDCKILKNTLAMAGSTESAIVDNVLNNHGYLPVIKRVVLDGLEAYPVYMSREHLIICNIPHPCQVSLEELKKMKDAMFGKSKNPKFERYYDEIIRLKKLEEEALARAAEISAQYEEARCNLIWF